MLNYVHNINVMLKRSLEQKPIEASSFMAQIREQMSGPDLHVFTLKFLAIKNWFSPINKIEGTPILKLATVKRL